MRPVVGHSLAGAAPGGNTPPESHLGNLRCTQLRGPRDAAKSDSSDGCTALVTALKTTELYTLNG